jgi:nitroreductase
MNTQDLTVSEAARNRVSIRRYTDRPVTRELLLEVLEIAGKAPSAWNVQPWRVKVVQDPETKAKLMAAAYGQPQVGAAPAVLVVASDMEDALSRIEEWLHPGIQGERREQELANIRATFEKMGLEGRASWGRNQTNIFLGYLLLALASKGLGSSPMLGFNPAEVKELLGLPSHVEIPALVAVGWPAEDGFPQHRLDIGSLVEFV